MKHQGLHLPLAPLAVKHTACPQKAPEQAEVNVKESQEKDNSCQCILKRRQQVVWVTKFALRRGWR